ncbi:MAG TPA: alcohol dehydrogenase [Pseudolabrys sp.]|nr:alcohol dehydrogenase [Pseudolabrys sp.]
MRMFQVCVCGQPLQLNEQPTPQPKGSEVLLKVLAAGVCHSDLHLSDGYFDLGGGNKLSLEARGMKLPVTLGHENVGEVVALGPDAKGVKVGDRVLADPWIGCGTCPACQRNEDNLCTAMRSLGVFSNGGYADYMMVPHPRYLFDIGDLAPERVAPLACSGVTTFGALKKVPTLKREPTVIIGAGGLGLMCLALHQKMGGHSAIVVDIDPAKREAAKKAGAKAVVDAKAPDAVAQIQKLTNGGAWAVIDLVGSTQSARLGFDSLIKGGKYIIVGLYGGDLTVSLPPLPMRALTIQGSYVGSVPEMTELMEIVRRTGLPDVPVSTRPLADVNGVMDQLRAGKVVGRVVLTPAAG